MAHVQAIALPHSIPVFIEKNRKRADDACGKFAFENIAVSCENVTIKVRFLIKIPFVCSDSMHKVVGSCVLKAPVGRHYRPSISRHIGQHIGRYSVDIRSSVGRHVGRVSANMSTDIRSTDPGTPCFPQTPRHRDPDPGTPAPCFPPNQLQCYHFGVRSKHLNKKLARALATLLRLVKAAESPLKIAA